MNRTLAYKTYLTVLGLEPRFLLKLNFCDSMPNRLISQPKNVRKVVGHTEIHSDELEECRGKFSKSKSRQL